MGQSNLFGISMRELEHSFFMEKMEREINSGKEFPSLMQVLDICPKGTYPSMHALLTAIITLPMTSCTVERLFSATNRIKTRLRSSMTTPRLNNCTLLSFERELSDELDFDEIISIFNSKPRRLRLVM